MTMLPGEAKAKYKHHAHRVQAGIAALIDLASSGKTDYTAHTPKQLRVGVDTSKADQGSLARLLIAKGIITEDEYCEALADGMELEADAFEKDVQDAVGDDRIHLGSQY